MIRTKSLNLFLWLLLWTLLAALPVGPNPASGQNLPQNTASTDFAIQKPAPPLGFERLTQKRTAGACVVAKGGTTGGTSLFRSVGPEELADIQITNALRNLGSAEGKYFTTSAEAASSYAKQAVKGFGDAPYTLIETRVPDSIFKGLSPATVDRGIPAWVIPTERLQGLTPKILDSMPIPHQ